MWERTARATQQQVRDQAEAERTRTGLGNNVSKPTKGSCAHSRTSRAPPRRSFTEQIPAGARITGRLRAASGRRVRDAGCTVIQTARDLHLSWPTVMNAFRTAAGEVVGAPLPEVEVLGIDETRRGRTAGNKTWAPGSGR